MHGPAEKRSGARKKIPADCRPATKLLIVALQSSSARVRYNALLFYTKRPFFCNFPRTRAILRSKIESARRELSRPRSLGARTSSRNYIDEKCNEKGVCEGRFPFQPFATKDIYICV